MSTETQRFEFRLPDPGEGLTEAEVVEWFVEAGETIQEDEPLCDVETDKAAVEIPAPCTGEVVELVADPGDIVAVGEVIAVFETEHPPRQQVEAPADTGPSGAGDRQAETQERRGRVSDGEATVESAVTRVAESDAPDPAVGSLDEQQDPETDVFAAPSTRRYAREHDIDLARVEGSGPGGRILRSDVEAVVDTGRSPDAVDRTSRSPSQPGTESPESDVVRRPLRGLRRTIAENMARSKREIPHVTSGFEADAAAFRDLREGLNEKHEPRITYTALLAKAVVPALQAYPELNASVDMAAEEIIEHHRYHIGIATDTDEGLIVPVIDDVDRKSLVDVAAELETLILAARDRDLEPADLRGSTFTITNMGSHGGSGTFGTPIINHPESAILGVGRIQNKPVAVNDEDVEVRKRIGLTLSFDHRIIDGVTAAKFAEHVVESIEDPEMFLSRI